MENPFLNEKSHENLSKRIRDTLDPLVVGESVAVGVRGQSIATMRSIITNGVSGKFRTKQDIDNQVLWVKRVEQ